LQGITTRAPGRINIIGEHIDYHDGYVLPAAVGCEVRMTVERNDTPSTIHASAEDLQERYSFDLNAYKPISAGWQNFIMGVFHELEKLGAKFSGCDLSFNSTVPIGAGMSSSAALECSLALALNELFELGLSKIQLIKASQMAEHNFVGIKCGIMDQFASFREVTADHLMQGKSHMNDDIYRRCRHVHTEIQRTQDACAAMRANDLSRLGAIIYQGHKSLQNDYEVTCAETDFLVDYTSNKSAILGARQMGGGFGGCTINLIHKDAAKDFIADVDNAYGDLFDKSVTPYIMDIADGASIISSH